MSIAYVILTLLIVGGLFFGIDRAPSDSEEAPPQEPAAPATAELRLPVSALLLGGLTLVILGQSVYTATQPNAPLSLYILMGVGVVAFLGAGRLVVRGSAGPWRNTAVRRASDYFGLQPGQLVLLLLAPLLAYLARLAAGDGLLAIQAPASIAAWLLAAAAVVAGSYRRDIPIRLTRSDLLLTAVLFVAAYALRGTLLGQIPTTLSGDEGSAGLAAVHFLDGRADNLFALGWFSFPALYFAVQSAGIWLLGQTTEGLRLMSALAGAGTVVGLFWLARALFDRTTALLAAIALLAAHYHIHFSRIGLQNIWDGFFLVWCLAGLWAGWQRGWRTGFILCGLALGLGQYFYVSMRVVPLLLLIWAGAAFLLDGDRFKERLPDLALAAFIAAVIFLPLGLFFVEHPAEFNAPMQRVTILDGWLANEVQLTGQPAWRIVMQQISNTALGFTHLPLRHWYNPGTPLLLAAPAALFLLGLLWSIVDFDLRYLLILLPILSIVLLGGFSQDAPASQRFVLAAPMAAVLVALPLGKTAVWLRQFWPRWERLIVTAVLLVMITIAFGDIRFYFTDVYETYVLGGINTEAATQIAYYLRDSGTPGQKVYFFGLPRMGYYSLSTIPYLAPEMRGEDVIEPLAAPPTWELDGPTSFIFLPERITELTLVQSAYPGGLYREVFPLAAASPPHYS